MKQALTFDDVLLVPKQGVLDSRKDADISSELVSGYKLDVPIVSANMPSVTDSRMANAMYKVGGFGILHRFNELGNAIMDFEEVLLDMRDAGCSFGYRDWGRVEALYKSGCRIFCLDVAHGDHHLTIKHIYEFKNSWPDCKLIVGNVATPEGAGRLALTGIDAIKIGIGPGAACRTREVTGFGVPQLTAIMDIANSPWRKYNSHVKLIADGGIKNS